MNGRIFKGLSLLGCGIDEIRLAEAGLKALALIKVLRVWLSVCKLHE